MTAQERRQTHTHRRRNIQFLPTARLPSTIHFLTLRNPQTATCRPLTSTLILSTLISNNRLPSMLNGHIIHLPHLCQNLRTPSTPIIQQNIPRQAQSILPPPPRTALQHCRGIHRTLDIKVRSNLRAITELLRILSGSESGGAGRQGVSVSKIRRLLIPLCQRTMLHRSCRR